MKTLRNLILIAMLASQLSGCVLALSGDDGMHHGHWDDNYYSDSDQSDRSLAEAVRNSLDSNSQTKGAAISVYSHDGTVTLQGTVKDAAVLGQAVAIAANTPGVQKVRCEIVLLKN